MNLKTCPSSIRQKVMELAEGAKERVPCYWLDGVGELPDENASLNFCREHAELDLERLRIEHGDKAHGVTLGGGYTTDHDSTPTCETCGVGLDGTLTEHGAREELRHFGEHPPKTPDDYADFLIMLDAFTDAGQDVGGTIEAILDRSIGCAIVGAAKGGDR